MKPNKVYSRLLHTSIEMRPEIEATRTSDDQSSAELPLEGKHLAAAGAALTMLPGTLAFLPAAALLALALGLGRDN